MNKTRNFLNKLKDLPRQKIRREVALNLLSLLFLFGVLSLYEGIKISYVNWKITEPILDSPRKWMVADFINQGDDAFKAYRYVEAHRLYKKADSTLGALIKFENESPSKNVETLQRYYNSQTFIKTRMKLALIADDISHIEDAR